MSRPGTRVRAVRAGKPQRAAESEPPRAAESKPPRATESEPPRATESEPPRAAAEGTAAPLVPADATLPRLRAAAAGCRACDLWERGTQTVFGEGADGADLMLVGEQPGDAEDLAGRPFVGPAGKLLDRALEAAGIDPARVYKTNAVKHFRWEPRGKRRIHAKPSAPQIRACVPWLHAEIAVVRPAVIVCLGATAAQALLGAAFRVTRDRGKLVASPLAPRVLATVHPASVLRAPDQASREASFAGLVKDLSIAAGALR